MDPIRDLHSLRVGQISVPEVRSRRPYPLPSAGPIGTTVDRPVHPGPWIVARAIVVPIWIVARVRRVIVVPMARAMPAPTAAVGIPARAIVAPTWIVARVRRVIVVPMARAMPAPTAAVGIPARAIVAPTWIAVRVRRVIVVPMARAMPAPTAAVGIHGPRDRGPDMDRGPRPQSDRGPDGPHAPTPIVAPIGIAVPIWIVARVRRVIVAPTAAVGIPARAIVALVRMPHLPGSIVKSLGISREVGAKRDNVDLLPGWEQKRRSTPNHDPLNGSHRRTVPVSEPDRMNRSGSPSDP